MKIKVSQRDIDRGDPCDGRTCSIALAMYRNGFDELVVSPQSVEFEWNGRFMDVKLPRIARSFVSQFDDGRPAHPFSFELNFNKEI